MISNSVPPRNLEVLWHFFLGDGPIKVAEKISFLGVIVTGLGLIGTAMAIFFNMQSNKRNNYVNSISAERIQWINNIRGLFSRYNDEFADLYYVHLNETSKSKVNPLTKINIGVSASAGITLSEQYKKLGMTANLIELHLNPSEATSNMLINQFQYAPLFEIDLISGDYIHGNESLEYIKALQQIVLKAEWKRVKREQEINREMNGDDFLDLTIQVANRIAPSVAIDISKHAKMLKDKVKKEKELLNEQL